MSRERRIAPIFSQKQFLTLSLLVALLIGISLAIRYYRESYIISHWQEIDQAAAHEISRTLQERFSVFERNAFNEVDSFVIKPETQALFSMDDDSLQQAYFFEKILPQLHSGISLEVYDQAGELFGWSGSRGIGIDLIKQVRNRRSIVVRDPIYSYLVVAVPVLASDSVQGYVISKKLIEVMYPINNRFINSKGLNDSFVDELPWGVQFLSDETTLSDSLHFTTKIFNYAGEEIAYVMVGRGDLTSEIGYAKEYSSHLINFLIVGWFLLFCIQILSLPVIRRSSLRRLCFLSAAIWIVRYALVWIDFPVGILGSEIFDPMKFASSFGFGIAGSLGDTFLSALAFGINVVLAAVECAKSSFLMNMSTKTIGLWKKIIAFTLIIFIVFVIAAFTRGFLAMIHSAVYDSNLSYSDPTFVLPPFDLSIMLLSLIIVTVSLIVISALFLSICWKLSGYIFSHSNKIFRSMILCMIGTPIVLVFGNFQNNPLIAPVERLIFFTVYAVVSVIISRVYTKRQRFWNFEVVLTVFTASIILLVPVLDAKVHALDRTHVELMADELSRPENKWLALMTRQSLSEIANAEVAEIVSTNDSSSLHTLAFTQWAKSILSKQGSDCSVTYGNLSDSIVSEFHLGIPVHAFSSYVDILPKDSLPIHVEEKLIHGKFIKWYVGYASLLSKTGVRVGSVRVEVSEDRQSISQFAVPAFLRNVSGEKFQTNFRPVYLSEYYQGKLVSTTGETFSLDKELPVDLFALLGKQLSGLWLEEEIEGQKYESYYFAIGNAEPSSTCMALSMPTLDLRWHIYSFLRYIIFYLFIVLVGIIVFVTQRVVRRVELKATFRTRLLAVFVFVSLIPILILVYYNHVYSRQQSNELNAKRLMSETALAVSEIHAELVSGVPATLARLSDAQCEKVSDELNVDFNIYYGAFLQASSEREMFTSELLDTRLSANAFREIVLKKKKFFLEDQRIGTVPYVVGYRPLIAENGSIMGVVSVPSLNRQLELSEDVTRRNVFLYGAYAVALILSVIVGTMFANQISRPIRRLMLATQEIGMGKLDLPLQDRGQDEFGELEHAFRKMTNDLKLTQDQMIQAQRELAWREMAKQVAHEIKNPLTPMKLSIQHLRQAYKDGVKDFASLLDRISTTLLDQIDTLSRIASEFSHFARMPSRVLESCAVNDVLEEAKNLFQQDGVHFELRYDPLVSTIRADREELRRAFINLLRNAIQAMQGKGIITLETKHDEESVEITIHDSGPGIPPNVLSRLFEPNFSTKTDGMGLGLPIVKRIIDELGGTIAVKSTTGAGTTVHMRFPISRADNDEDGS